MKLKIKNSISQLKISEEALQINKTKQANDRISRHKVKNCNNKKKRKRGKIYKGQPSQDRNRQKMYTVKILNPQIIGIEKGKEGRRVILVLPVSQVLG